MKIKYTWTTNIALPLSSIYNLHYIIPDFYQCNHRRNENRKVALLCLAVHVNLIGILNFAAHNSQLTWINFNPNIDK